ncbi:uncharacterized protein LOC125187041 [Salvia hispanica]|uniref:uncharacterized protein LOC125187041 n=1 Tax=Salvia hispanica TaxID=49212 RepID=UPI00200916D7|nr:uncharacterized protein LOC125187041 [Salvia hispanica]
MGREWVSWIGGKREKMASGGCMYAVLHLFHAHHRNHSNTYPFIQEQQPTTTTGLEAPRNSLEELKQEEDLKFPVGIKIKSKEYYIASECDTPSVVARLMGLDLLPQQQCTSPSITTKSPLLLQIDVARSLPDTPRTSSSSRKSDVKRHRLSLEMNKENAFSPSDGGRRLDQDDKRIRSVGLLDITNTYHTKSKIVSEDGEGEVKQSITTNSEKVVNKFPITKERQQHKESKKASGKCKKLPREDGFVGSKEKKKSNLAVQKNCNRTLVKIRNGAAKLPQKQSQVSNATIISWKSSTQLSSKPCIQTPTNVSPAAWSEHENYIQKLVKLKAGAGLSRRWERKLIFELVDEVVAENLTRQLRFVRKSFYHVRDDGGFRLVEELYKKIGGFRAAKCVVLEDIDSLIDKDWYKENWDGFEDTVGQIECEIVEWLVDEAVAVMGGDAAEELLFVA